MSEFGTGSWGVDLSGAGEGTCDTVPPVIVWTLPSAPVLPSSPVTVTFTDNLGELRLTEVRVFMPGAQTLDIAWSGSTTGPSALGPRYTGSAVPLSLGHSVTFLRSGGWTEGLVFLTAIAIDYGGNRVDSNATLTVDALALAAASPTTGGETEAGRVFKIDVLTGDMVRSGGRFVRIGGLDSIRQACQSALSFVAGEWFADLELGVPYFEQVFLKNPDHVAIRDAFRSQLLGVPGVNEVLQLNLVRDSGRDFTLSWRVDTDLGEIGLETSSLSLN